MLTSHLAFLEAHSKLVSNGDRSRASLSPLRPLQVLHELVPEHQAGLLVLGVVPGEVHPQRVLPRALLAADLAPPAAEVEVRVLQVDLDVAAAAERAAAEQAAPLGRRALAELGHVGREVGLALGDGGQRHGGGGGAAHL